MHKVDGRQYLGRPPAKSSVDLLPGAIVIQPGAPLSISNIRRNGTGSR